MTLRVIVFLALVGLVLWGLRSIFTDWRKAFRAGDAAAQERHRARLERNRAQARGPSVVELEQGEDGVYRPRDSERENER